MKIYLFENKKHHNKKGLKSIELFGLSRSGKTTLLKKLIKRGNKCFLIGDFSFNKKWLLFLRHFIKSPFKTFYLFYKLNTNWIILPSLTIKDYIGVFLLRNSYLAAVLAKYEALIGQENKFFIDEFLLQSVIMIIHKRSSKDEILKILKNIPAPAKILLIESSSRERYNRIKKTRFPGEQINRDYSITWMKNIEYNYKIIKRILKREYGPVVQNPKI